MAICCRLTSTLDIVECSISININTSTEIVKECTDDNGNTLQVLTGGTTGTLSLNSYAAPTTGDISIYYGCPESASLSVPWVRKYDCTADETYFINGGQGTSTIVGDSASLVGVYSQVSITHSATTTKSLSASASGPGGRYTIQDQINGYGLSYSGGPLSVDSGNLTRTVSEIINDNSLISGFGMTGATILYLQNFGINYTPEELPTVNYSFAFSL